MSDTAIEALRYSEFPNNSDTISRQAAIEAMSESLKRVFPEHRQIAEKCLNALPSAQPEKRTEERAETHACDCISRAEAIELKPEFLNPNVNRKTKEQTAIDRAYARGWNSCNTHWIDEISELPSAQPEPLILPDIYVAKDYDSVESEDGSAGFGVYIPSEKQIYVAGDVPNEVFVKALFHELLHWVQDATGNPFDEDEANAFADRIYYALQSSQPDKETAKRVLWSGWKGYRNTRYKCPTCKKPVKNDDVYCHRCGQKLMFPHIDHTPYVPGEKQELIVRWDDE